MMIASNVIATTPLRGNHGGQKSCRYNTNYQTSLINKVNEMCRGGIGQCICCNNHHCIMANKNYTAMRKRRRRVSSTKQMFIWACVALFLPINYMYIAEALSSGNSGNAPFMVMSEITVQSDDGNVQSSDVLGENQNDSGGTTADGDNSSSLNNGENNSSSIDTNKNETGGNTNEQTMSESAGGSSGGGSDTDGEDEDKLLGNRQEGDNSSAGFVHNASGKPFLQPSTNSVTTSVDSSTEDAASQPLRTLKRLQAMLDDSDYATHTVAPDSATFIASDVTNNANEVIENVSQSSDSHTDPPPIQQAVSSSSTPPPIHNTNNNPMSGPEKLWTSKDRAKYRRTRRTEKQRQQQREYEEQHARKIRDIQRQRIIREERERKELEELRLKRAEAMERQKRYEEQQKQQQLNQFMHYNDGDNTDFTDDDTDTDGGKGFDLPNLPVYLSDGEATDDFSEEMEESAPKMMHHRRPPIRPSSNYPPPNNNSRQRGPYQRPPLPQNMAQQHYQNAQHPAQQIPPQANMPGPYQNYQQQQQQYPPPYSQPQQSMPHQQQYQYNGQPNNNPNPQQTMQENHQRQYEQQYAAWAQAASNGYYYPPPPQLPPTAASFQQAQVLQQSQQQAQQRQHPSYTHQYPYQNQQHPQPQHPYHAQQQVGEKSSGNPNPYASIPQPFVPRRTNLSQGSEQQGFYNRVNEGIEEWQMGQQSQDQLGSQSTSSGSEATLNFPAQPMANQNNEVTATSETSTPTATSISTNNGPMGVQSAFVVPPQPQSASPLISLQSSGSREAIVAPINAEGPYCELVDESVSFVFVFMCSQFISYIFLIQPFNSLECTNCWC